MKSLFIVLAGVLILSACAKPTPPTVEEQVLTKIFASLIGAGEYDRVCNAGKVTQSEVGKDNANWYGNMQTIVALMAAPMRVRFPDESIEQGVKRLQRAQEKVEERARKILKEQGCNGVAGEALAKSLDRFVKTPPYIMFSVIAEEVKKQGGAMTELTEEQNRVPPQEKAGELPAPATESARP